MDSRLSRRSSSFFAFSGEIGLTRVVDDVLHDTADVAMALGVIEGAELGRGLVQARVGRCCEHMVRDVEVSRDAKKFDFRCRKTASREPATH